MKLGVSSEKLQDLIVTRLYLMKGVSSRKGVVCNANQKLGMKLGKERKKERKKFNVKTQTREIHLTKIT
jgi:hypothetical protein